MQSGLQMEWVINVSSALMELTVTQKILSPVLTLHPTTFLSKQEVLNAMSVRH